MHNLNRNQRLQKLAAATIACDAPTLQEIITNNRYDPKWLKNMNLFREEIPVYYLTLCNQSLLALDGWSESMVKVVAQMRINCEQCMEIWSSVVPEIHRIKIDYHSLGQLFYSSTGLSNIDILDNDTQVYLEAGCTTDEIEFYCDVKRFDFKAVEQLLKRGVDPNVILFTNRTARKAAERSEDRRWDYENEMEHAFSRIGMECSFLSTQITPIWREYIFHQSISTIKKQDICDLIGWAAHEKMYTLLEKYSTEKEKTGGDF